MSASSNTSWVAGMYLLFHETLPVVLLQRKFQHLQSEFSDSTSAHLFSCLCVSAQLEVGQQLGHRIDQPVTAELKAWPVPLR